MDPLCRALIRASHVAVDASDDPQRVLEELLQCIQTVVPTVSSTVLLLREGEARVCAHRGWAAFGDPTGLTFPATAPHLRAVSEGLSVVIDDTDEQPGWRKVRGSHHTRSWLGVPILADGVVFGLYALDQDRPNAFTDEHVELVEAFAAHGAAVMKSARLLDEARRAKQEADRASQVKSAFLANTSHELRTPLSAIVGYAEMLREGAQAAGMSECLDDTGHLLDAAHHLLELVNTLLDLSQIESGKLELHAQPVSMAELVREVASTVAPLARSNGNELQVAVPAAELPCVTDAHRVRQVLLNLLGNAIKFTRDGVVQLELAVEQGGLAVHVTDTGIGMTAEELSRVFEPYQQANDHIRGQFGGTGLGLTVSRELAWRLGGDLFATSEAGRGTTFTLLLPTTLDLSEPPRRPAARSRGAPRPAGDAAARGRSAH
jgi:signal transduction histidine kinase